MPERKPFLLRVNAQLLEALQRWASDDLRSLNGQIEFLLRRALEDAGRRAGESGARRVGARSPSGLAFLFEVGLGGCDGPRRGAERLAVIEQGHAADVAGHLAALGFPLDHDRHGTALHAVPEADEAAARQAGVQPRLGHGRSNAGGKSALICSSNHSRLADPGCFRCTVPSGLTNHVMGIMKTASYVSSRAS